LATTVSDKPAPILFSQPIKITTPTKPKIKPIPRAKESPSLSQKKATTTPKGSAAALRIEVAPATNT